MKKSKCVWGILLLFLLAAGCGQMNHQENEQEEFEEEKIKIGVSFDSFVIERWQKDRDVFVATAKENGAEVNVQNANGDLTEQISQIEYLIRQKMDVIVIVGIDSNKMSSVVKKAKDAGIIVVAYDRMLNNADIDLYISFDNEKVGALMAAALIDQNKTDQKVIMLCGSPTDNNVVQVESGFRKVMEANGVEILDVMYAEGWRAEYAGSYIYENIDKVMKADGIMCGNDNLATMVVHALAEKQLAGKIKVVGQDADLEACQRIVEGTQAMTVYKPIEKQAREAALCAIRLAQGDALSELPRMESGDYEFPYVMLEPEMIDKQNIDELIIKSGVHLKDDVYLNIPHDDNMK